MRRRLGDTGAELPDLLARTFSAIATAENNAGLGGSRGFARTIRKGITEKRWAAVAAWSEPGYTDDIRDLRGGRLPHAN